MPLPVLDAERKRHQAHKHKLQKNKSIKQHMKKETKRLQKTLLDPLKKEIKNENHLL